MRNIRLNWRGSVKLPLTPQFGHPVWAKRSNAISLFSRIFVNLKTLEIQGYIYPFVVTVNCSSIEPKAYFTVKTCNDLRIMGDFKNSFAIFGVKIQEIAKFIKNVEG